MVQTSETQNSSIKKVLIIEDEPTIADLIALTLQSFELNVSVDKSLSVEKALSFLQTNQYDVIVVDWMLPGIQGIDFVKQLKNSQPDQMILMVTAKADPDSIVKALESGVDDYVSKPFEPTVLNARLKNLLKRSEQLKKLRSLQQAQPLLGANEVIEFAGLTVDYGRVDIAYKGQSIHLTPSEFKLLGYLLKSQGRVLSRDQLIDLIQGEDVSVTGRTIDTHIFALRKKLSDWSDHIERIRGVGYRVNYSK